MPVAAHPRPVGTARPGDHLCLAFGSDAEQQEVAAAFVRDGLNNQEKVFYIADTAPAAVPGFLHAAGTESALNVQQGRLVVLGTGETYLAGGPFNPDAMIVRLHRMVSDTLAEGYAGFRVAGEMSWALRGGLDAERMVTYEQMATGFFATRPALALCQYDRRRFPADGLEAIQAAHPGVAGPDPVYADAILTLTRTYVPAGLRIAGEIDRTNAQALSDALATVAVADGPDVHLDVSVMGFTDVSGARVLAQAAQRLAGRHLILHGAGGEPRRVLRLSGWDQLPNIVIAGEWS